MDQYATHQRLLVAAVMQTEGPIVEMGCGNYSTPLLVELLPGDGAAERRRQHSNAGGRRLRPPTEARPGYA